MSNKETFISRCLARYIPVHVKIIESAYKNPRNMIYRYEKLPISDAKEVAIASYVAIKNSRMPIVI